MRIKRFAVMGTVFVFALSSAVVLSGGAKPAVAFVGIDSSIRPNDFLPVDHSAEAMQYLAKSVGGSVDLANVRFKVKLPQRNNRTGEFTHQDLEKVSVDIVGPAAKGLKISIDPTQSELKTANVNGDDVVFGQLTGAITYPDGSKSEMTTGVIALTRQHMGHFTVAISAHNGVPPLAIAFGNLDPTPELLQLVVPKTSQ